MVMFLVAFSSIARGLNNNSVRLRKRFVYFEEKFITVLGLYANLIAQILSQITSDYIIDYQRKVVKAGNAKINGQDNVISSSTTSPNAVEWICNRFTYFGLQ